jgi:hypothetical protein
VQHASSIDASTNGTRNEAAMATLTVELCGKFDEVVSSFWEKLLQLFGLMLLISIIQAAIAVYGTPQVLADIAAWLLKTFGITVSVYLLVAVVVAIVVTWIAWAAFVDDCVGDGPGDSRCFTGVVAGVHEEEVGGVLFPKHPHIDLVVRSAYLPILFLFKPDMIECTESGGSIVKVFFKSDRICGIRLANAIGATVGAIGGAIAGTLAGAALAAALGCAASGPFYILCVLLVLLVVALIVLAAAAIGAMLAGGVTALASEPDMPTATDGGAIAVGHLLSAEGPTARNNNFDGQVCQYFNKCTSALNIAPRSGPYSNADADEFISDTADSCQLNCPD